MLSRVADHLYWMSRYMERAENLARLVQVNSELLLDAEAVGTGELATYWQPVLAATALEELFYKHHPAANPEQVAAFLTVEAENPTSIISCISEARENARTIRDQISDEMWSELNALYLFTKREGVQLFQRSPQSFYDKIIQSSLLFDGITAATLPRNEGWQFLQVGRFLERADKTSRFLDIRSHNLISNPDDDALGSIQWSSILRSCSAFAPYRRLFGSEISTERVLELLIFSTDFPRSVRFCARQADDLLHEISGTATGQFTNAAEKLSGTLLADLNFSGPSDVLTRGLHEYIDDLQIKLNKVGEAVLGTYVLLPRELNRMALPSIRLDDGRRLQQQQQQQQ